MMRIVWQLIATLVIVAIIARVIIWILLTALAAAAIWAIRSFVIDIRRGQELERAQRKALIARADQQHQWVMVGDPRGTYGEVPKTEQT